MHSVVGQHASDESKELIADMMQCPKSELVSNNECATSDRIIRLWCFCIGLNNNVSLFWFSLSQHVL